MPRYGNRLPYPPRALPSPIYGRLPYPPYGLRPLGVIPGGRPYVELASQKSQATVQQQAQRLVNCQVSKEISDIEYEAYSSGPCKKLKTGTSTPVKESTVDVVKSTSDASTQTDEDESWRVTMLDNIEKRKEEVENWKGKALRMQTKLEDMKNQKWEVQMELEDIKNRYKEGVDLVISTKSAYLKLKEENRALRPHK